MHFITDLAYAHDSFNQTGKPGRTEQIHEHAPHEDSDGEVAGLPPPCRVPTPGIVLWTRDRITEYRQLCRDLQGLLGPRTSRATHPRMT